MLCRLTSLDSIFVSAAVVAAGALIATSATEAHKDVLFRGSVAKDSDGELQSSNKNMNGLHVPRKLADKNGVVDKKGLDMSLHMKSREEKTTINIGRNRQLRNTNTKYDAGEREDSIAGDTSAGDIIIDVGILHGNAVPINANGERERERNLNDITSDTTLSERDQYCLELCGPDRKEMTADDDLYDLASTYPDDDINCWNTSQITNMDKTFYKADNPLLSLRCWDVSSVTSMYEMFKWFRVSFDGNINEWNVSSVTNMEAMFWTDDFNQPVDAWDVSSVKNMARMFAYSKFYQLLDAWDVSSVTTMEYMFEQAHFNQKVDSWDVSSVTSMKGMFMWAKEFNQPVDAWDVSSVTTMYNMFRGTNSFNQTVESWDVSSVSDMKTMFWRSISFNHPVDVWNVSSVTTMERMFELADTFNQCISSWGAKVTKNDVPVNVHGMFEQGSEICSVQVIPDSLDGPWCQDESNQCYAATCVDDLEFHLDDDDSKNCEWVALGGGIENRCAIEGVFEACSQSCNPVCFGGCFDDPNFKLNGVEHKTCDWVAKQKTEERCKKPGVLSACRHTCKPLCDAEAVDCTNDQDFQLNGIKAKTCEWVAKQKTNERCKKPGVMNACRQTCNPSCGCTDITEEFDFQGGMITCEDLDINYCDAELISSGNEFFQQIQDILNEALIPIHEKLAVVNQQLEAIRDVEDDAEEEISADSVLDRKTYGDLCRNKCKSENCI